MRYLKPALLATSLLAASTTFCMAEVKVVASIKPVHSLVSAVMEGVGTPGLIIEGAGSPHTYSMKPSQAAALQEADVVFWIGHELEAFLEKPVEAIAGKAKSVELIDAHDLVKLEFREGGAFDAHDHGDHEGHDHAAKDDHAHDHDKEAKVEHDHDHDHDKEAKEEHDHGHEHDKEAKAEHSHGDHGHDEHAHEGSDPHVWLDPVNAKALVHEIEETLVIADPANAEKYEANAEALMSKLDALVEEVAADLESSKGAGFVVFHDAYHYFENRFGLKASGSITVSPEVIPGAERISELREKTTELGAVCIFSEPQFEPKLVQTVAEGTNARTAVLDPLGANLEDGPELYFSLIRNMTASFKDCLSPTG